MFGLLERRPTLQHFCSLPVWSFRRILQNHDIPVEIKPSNTPRHRAVLVSGETNQLLHRRVPSSQQDSAGRACEDGQGRVLGREDRWFERGVEEALHVELEKPLNRVTFYQQSRTLHCFNRPIQSTPCDLGDKREGALERLCQRLSGDHLDHWHGDGPQGL